MRRDRSGGACREEPEGASQGTTYDGRRADPAAAPTIPDMTRRFIGVRWWLGAAFAVVAATSTAIVVSQFSNRSENAFRRHGEQLALKDARLAAHTAPAKLGRDVRIFHAPGQAKWQLARTAAVAALSGQEVSQGTADGGPPVAGIPHHRGALVAIARLPDVAEAIDTVNGEALRAVVIAGLI